jgi:uncharacterized protein with NAD-binding domain and iron-sulfur cluster
VTIARPDVAILGGGMAAMAAAWRLSEPGWERDLGSITVYQRGWRLGGKGASSRGVHGRVEEHGLHLWLGYYENAFRLLREVYAELDREHTDPQAPIRTWREAMLPTQEVGLEDRDQVGWHHWVGLFTPNDELPGEPGTTGREVTVVDLARRALRLVADFLASLPTEVATRGGTVSLSGSAAPPTAVDVAVTGIPIAVAAGILEAATRLHVAAERPDLEGAVGGLDDALASIREALADRARTDADLRRTWHLISVMTAAVRGVLADGLLTDPRGFHAIDDEDFLDWIVRHGASPDVAEFAFIRGLYDLVFADGGADRAEHGVSAGVAVFMTSKMFFEYKGAIFWKMAAGMGDIVFAPMYEALRRRGVQFELFHRVDQLHLSPDRTFVDAITVGRQAALADGVDQYDPLVRVGGLPVFPAAPLAEQLAADDGIAEQPLESHWCRWPVHEVRTLRRGEDFDVVVFAIPVAMAELVCQELIEDRPEWKAMVHGLSTTATQALQLWLRDDEPSLGWPHPGATVSAYAQPFNTWASMDQLVAVEPWPDADRPGTIAYFCGALDAPWPPDGEGDDYPRRQHERARRNARQLVEQDLPHLLPGVRDEDGFRWDLLCGAGGATGDAALDTQLVLANVDPSDRYVRCAPGTDRHRLRPDESGYDNLFLAGDWTDSGLNAGCIEAATMSGLQAANAVLGRPRQHRIAGFYLG